MNLLTLLQTSPISFLDLLQDPEARYMLGYCLAGGVVWSLILALYFLTREQ